MAHRRFVPVTSAQPGGLDDRRPYRSSASRTVARHRHAHPRWHRHRPRIRAANASYPPPRALGFFPCTRSSSGARSSGRPNAASRASEAAASAPLPGHRREPSSMARRMRFLMRPLPKSMRTNRCRATTRAGGRCKKLGKPELEGFCVERACGLTATTYREGLAAMFPREQPFKGSRSVCDLTAAARATSGWSWLART
jgi:hypothetical protein